LVLGSPDRRRRYLDFILTQTQSQYLTTLHRYRRVLKQRNHLLANYNGDSGELFAWNIKLAEIAADIDHARRRVIDHINQLAEPLYKDIAGSSQPLHLTYIGSLSNQPNPDPSAYTTTFLSALESNLPRDLGAGFTTIGPHRDDFDITFKGADITALASRGEMRTVVLVLKLAELAYIENYTGRSPVLLLDDVFSELDEQRRSYLINTLTDYQAIITTTDADTASKLGSSHIINTTEFSK
jgi:DNA replication and repair protein RecF